VMKGSLVLTALIKVDSLLEKSMRWLTRPLLQLAGKSRLLGSEREEPEAAAEVPSPQGKSPTQADASIVGIEQPIHEGMSPTSSEQSAHKSTLEVPQGQLSTDRSAADSDHSARIPAVVRESYLYRLSGLSPYLAVLTLCLVPFLTYKYLAVLFAAVILLTLVRGQWKEARHLLNNRYFIYISLFVLVVFLSSLFTYDRHESLSFFITNFLIGYTMMVVIFINFRQPAHFQWLKDGLVVSSLVLGLQGLYQFLHYDAINAQWINLEASASFMMRRIFTSFENPNSYAQYLVIVIALLTAFFFQEKNRGRKAIIGTVDLLLIVNLFLTFSRGGFLAIVVVALLLFLLYKQSFIVYSALAGVLTIPLWPEDLVRRFISIFSTSRQFYDASINYRQYAWLSGFDMIRDHFLAGIGTGQTTFLKFYGSYMINNVQVYHLHNTFMHYFVTCGIAAFLLLLILVVYNLKIFTRAARLAERHASSIQVAVLGGLACGMVGFFLTAISEDVFRMYRVYLTFWLYSGVMLAAMARPRLLQPEVAQVGVYPPPSGGISIHIQRLCDRLDKQRIPYNIYDIRKGDKDRNTIYVDESRINTRAVRYFFTASEDVIHIHLHSWTVRFLLSLLRLRGKKIIITVHSLRDEKSRDTRAKRLLIWLTGLLTHSFIAVTEDIKNGLRAYHIPARKIQVIPAFIPPVAEPAPLPSELVDFLRPGTLKIVSYAQDISYFAGEDIYGVTDCIRLAGKLEAEGRDYRFAFILNNLTDPHQLEAVEQLIRQEKAEEHFRIFLMDIDFYALLKEADVYIRANHHDGDSLAVREALYLGKQVLGSDAAPRPEGTFVFHTGDTDNLHHTLLQALNQKKPAQYADFSRQIIDRY
jgi:glycosyltransferase involved in cell wall biosynthesis/O-antigen ligase